MTDQTPRITYVYVLYDDGTPEKQSYTGAPEDFEPVLSKPGKIVTEAQYLARVAQIEAANAAHEAELREQELAAIKADYEALRAAGIPETTARRITGYTGP